MMYIISIMLTEWNSLDNGHLLDMLCCDVIKICHFTNVVDSYHLVFRFTLAVWFPLQVFWKCSSHEYCWSHSGSR